MRALKHAQHAFLAFALLALAGCSGHKLLYKHATDPVSASKVVLLHHNALGETVVALRNDPLVSASTKADLRAAYRTTVCSKDEISANAATEACKNGPAQLVQRTAEAYATIRSAQNEAQLQVAIDALTRALVEIINLTRS